LRRHKACGTMVDFSNTSSITEKVRRMTHVTNERIIFSRTCKDARLN
jgi:hypothetical protein